MIVHCFQSDIRLLFPGCHDRALFPEWHMFTISRVPWSCIVFIVTRVHYSGLCQRHTAVRDRGSLNVHFRNAMGACPQIHFKMLQLVAKAWSHKVFTSCVIFLHYDWHYRSVCTLEPIQNGLFLSWYATVLEWLACVSVENCEHLALFSQAIHELVTNDDLHV